MLRPTRPEIWCEVTCCHCGGIIGTAYRNAKSISRLKEKTRDWKCCIEAGGNLCPECYEKLKKEYRN